MANPQFLFFASNFNSSAVADSWRSFLREFRKRYGDFDAHFVVSRQASLEFVDAILEETVAQSAIESEVVSNDVLWGEHKHTLLHIRDQAFLSRIRLFPEYSKDPRRADLDSTFEDVLLGTINFFLTYLKRERIETVCIDPFSAFVDPNARVLEAVSKHLDIILAISGKGSLKGRAKIHDNLNRTCADTDKYYLEVLARGGLNKDERSKVQKYLKSYRQFQNSEKLQYYLWKNRQPSRKHRLGTQIRQTLFRLKSRRVHHASRVVSPSRDFRHSRYVVFFPNKPNNHRTFSCDPFYSDYHALISAIAISLPHEYFLVIKDHPHTIGFGTSDELRRTVDRFDNVVYCDPRESNTEVVDGASIVFGVASTSSLEALLSIKHLVMFGADPYVFGSLPEAPIERVTSLEDLPAVIQRLLKEEPPEHRILAYVYAILVNSSQISDSDADVWSAISHFVPFRERISKLTTLLTTFVRKRQARRFEKCTAIASPTIRTN